MPRKPNAPAKPIRRRSKRELEQLAQEAADFAGNFLAMCAEPDRELADNPITLLLDEDFAARQVDDANGPFRKAYRAARQHWQGMNLGEDDVAELRRMISLLPPPSTPPSTPPAEDQAQASPPPPQNDPPGLTMDDVAELRDSLGLSASPSAPRLHARRVRHLLERPLTDAELLAHGRDLADHLRELARIEHDRKEAMADFKARRAPHEVAVQDLARAVNTRRLVADVECVEVVPPGVSKLLVFRLDTGALALERQLGDDDRQVELPELAAAEHDTLEQLARQLLDDHRERGLLGRIADEIADWSHGSGNDYAPLDGMVRLLEGGVTTRHDRQAQTLHEQLQSLSRGALGELREMLTRRAPPVEATDAEQDAEVAP